MMTERAPSPDGSGADRSSPIISVAQLAAALGSADPPVLLDVRWSLAGPPGRDDYRRGHLRGARFIDLDRDLAGQPGGGCGRHPLPEPGVFERAMRGAGVRDRSTVVVYDGGGGLSAARAWWLLRYHGHDRVRLLDGGLGAWIADGHPVTTEAAPVAEGDFTARSPRMPALDADGAAQLARAGILLDARADERYRGEVEPIDAVAGHIPGARSAPTTANLRTDGRFLPVEALRSRFAGLGASSDVAVGAYCGSGVTAAHEVLALTLAGIPAALYPGSWSEWVSDPSRPVAAGSDPG